MWLLHGSCFFHGKTASTSFLVRYSSFDFVVTKHFFLKVTVQFETEGNSQNEIFSHMDRSEVKL